MFTYLPLSWLVSKIILYIQNETNVEFCTFAFKGRTLDTLLVCLDGVLLAELKRGQFIEALHFGSLFNFSISYSRMADGSMGPKKVKDFFDFLSV